MILQSLVVNSDQSESSILYSKVVKSIYMNFEVIRIVNIVIQSRPNSIPVDRQASRA
jgi:hypothetical protein